MKNIGERLRQVRHEKKISIKRLASKIGIAYPYISQIESGKRIPSLKLVLKFVDFFNMAPDRFLGEKIKNRLITLSWIYIPSVESLSVKKILRELEKTLGMERTKQIFRLAIERPTVEEVLKENKKNWERTKEKVKRTPKIRQSLKTSKKPIIGRHNGRQRQSSKRKTSSSKEDSEDGEDSKSSSLITVDFQN